MRFGNFPFVIHDISAFPIVFQRADAVRPGYAAQWEREMDVLLQAFTAFVIILQQGQAEQSNADVRSRALWLERNRELSAAVCKAVIGIECDSAKQAVLTADAFGTKLEIAASYEEAASAARANLARHSL
ncbi:hypothetical protein LJR251_005967 [Rhizobium rhizogenes]|uniref:hypothetical protein n=1 Tax=Rhizobium rhizogenes TaxID=359 RepID=UPI003ECC9DFE